MTVAKRFGRGCDACTDLFRMAVGIEPPWVVTKSDSTRGQAAGHPPGFRQGQPVRLPAMRHCRLSGYDSEADLAALNFFQPKPTCMRGCRG